MLNEYDDNYYEIMESNLDFLEEIITSDDSFLKGDEKVIAIYTSDYEDLCKRFTGEPLKDIQKAYKKYYNLDVSQYRIVCVGFENNIIQEQLPNSYQDLPYMFTSDKNEFILLRDIDFLNFKNTSL